MSEKYLLVWQSSNPSTYIAECKDLNDLKDKLNELSRDREYPLYVIRCSDSAYAEVKGDHGNFSFDLSKTPCSPL